MSKLYKTAAWCALLYFIIGCKGGQTEFTQVVMDHNQVTSQTVDSLQLSIDMELNKIYVAPDEKQKLLDLKERLEYMKESAQVMQEYQIKANTDKELLAKLLKNTIANRSK